MTFTFPNPQFTSEFTGDNGIAYAWDIVDKKWQVKSFATGNKEQIVGAYRICNALKTLDPGEMIFGAPWGLIDASQINYIRIHETDGEGNSLPAGLIAAKTEFSLYRNEEGKAVKAATFTTDLFYEKPDSDYCEASIVESKTVIFEPLEFDVDYYLTAVVPPFDIKGYVDAADQHLQIQIDELEQEIDIIAPRLDGAQYRYVGSPAVKAGEMHIASGTFTAPTDLVLFSDQALDGSTHGWATLGEGDYLEITDTQEKLRSADNYAMYLVTKAPEGTGLKQIEVALVKGSGAPTVGDVHDAKGFQLGGSDINDLDDRYMRKDAKNLRLYKQDYVADYSDKNWKTHSPAAGTFELPVNGGQGWETNKSLIFRDLYTIFPPSEWEFCPGYVSGLEQNNWAGFDYAPQWQMRMDFCPRFDANGQVLRGYWKGNNPRNTAGKMYLRFECFRRK